MVWPQQIKKIYQSHIFLPVFLVLHIPCLYLLLSFEELSFMVYYSNFIHCQYTIYRNVEFCQERSAKLLTKFILYVILSETLSGKRLEK